MLAASSLRASSANRLRVWYGLRSICSTGISLTRSPVIAVAWGAGAGVAVAREAGRRVSRPRPRTFRLLSIIEHSIQGWRRLRLPLRFAVLPGVFGADP